MLALCIVTSVSNGYFAQPLPRTLARDFAFSDAWVGSINDAIQAGCALALPLVVPLGNHWPCKQVLLVQLVLLTSALPAVGLVQIHWSLLLGMLSTDLLGTAMTQGLIVCAAVSAPSPGRDHVVGAVRGGVVIGPLLAHALTSWIAEVAGWRAVYTTSVGSSVAILRMLWRALPTPPTILSPPRYIAFLRSMWQFLMAEPVLQGRGLIDLLIFAAFNVFWGVMALALSAPPYELSPVGIGAFGLAGVIGTLAAARAGHRADHHWAQAATGVALDSLLVAWLLLDLEARHLAGLIVDVILLNLGGQAVHMLNQSLGSRLRPEAHSWLVGVYMLFYAVDNGSEAVLSTQVHASARWSRVYLLGAALRLTILMFWAATAA